MNRTTTYMNRILGAMMILFLSLLTQCFEKDGIIQSKPIQLDSAFGFYQGIHADSISRYAKVGDSIQISLSRIYSLNDCSLETISIDTVNSDSNHVDLSFRIHLNPRSNVDCASYTNGDTVFNYYSGNRSIDLNLLRYVLDSATGKLIADSLGDSIKIRFGDLEKLIDTSSRVKMNSIPDPEKISQVLALIDTQKIWFDPAELSCQKVDTANCDTLYFDTLKTSSTLLADTVPMWLLKKCFKPKLSCDSLYDDTLHLDSFIYKIDSLYAVNYYKVKRRSGCELFDFKKILTQNLLPSQAKFITEEVYFKLDPEKELCDRDSLWWIWNLKTDLITYQTTFPSDFKLINYINP